MKWYIGLYEQTGIMAKPWVERGYNALCVDLDAEPGFKTASFTATQTLTIGYPSEKLLKMAWLLLRRSRLAIISLSVARGGLPEKGCAHCQTQYVFLSEQHSGQSGLARHT